MQSSPRPSVNKLTARLKNTMSVLVQMARVDEELDPRELSFIYGVGLRNGVDVDTIGDIIEHPDPEVRVDDLTLEDKIALLSDAIRLMIVDGRVLPREVAFCIEVADHLGIATIGVREFIDEIAIYPATDPRSIDTRIKAVV